MVNAAFSAGIADSKPPVQKIALKILPLFRRLVHSLAKSSLQRGIGRMKA